MKKTTVTLIFLFIIGLAGSQLLTKKNVKQKPKLISSVSFATNSTKNESIRIVPPNTGVGWKTLDSLDAILLASIEKSEFFKKKIIKNELENFGFDSSWFYNEDIVWNSVLDHALPNQLNQKEEDFYLPEFSSDAYQVFKKDYRSMHKFFKAVTRHIYDMNSQGLYDFANKSNTILIDSLFNPIDFSIHKPKFIYSNDSLIKQHPNLFWMFSSLKLMASSNKVDYSNLYSSFGKVYGYISYRKNRLTIDYTQPGEFEQKVWDNRKKDLQFLEVQAVLNMARYSNNSFPFIDYANDLLKQTKDSTITEPAYIQINRHIAKAKIWTELWELYNLEGGGFLNSRKITIAKSLTSANDILINESEKNIEWIKWRFSYFEELANYFLYKDEKKSSRKSLEAALGIINTYPAHFSQQKYDEILYRIKMIKSLITDGKTLLKKRFILPVSSMQNLSLSQLLKTKNLEESAVYSDLQNREFGWKARNEKKHYYENLGLRDNLKYKRLEVFQKDSTIRDNLSVISTKADSIVQVKKVVGEVSESRDNWIGTATTYIRLTAQLTQARDSIANLYMLEELLSDSLAKQNDIILLGQKNLAIEKEKVEIKNQEVESTNATQLWFIYALIGLSAILLFLIVIIRRRSKTIQKQKAVVTKQKNNIQGLNQILNQTSHLGKDLISRIIDIGTFTDNGQLLTDPKFIGQISRIFQKFYDRSKEGAIIPTIQDEIDFSCEILNANYIKLFQQHQFFIGKKVQDFVTCENQLLLLKIPKYVLVNIIQNSFRHTLMNKNFKGVKIRTVPNSKNNRLQIEDQGDKVKRNSTINGTGLSYISQTLEQPGFDPNVQFSISEDEASSTISFNLPKL